MTKIHIDSDLLYNLNGRLNLPKENDGIWMKVVEKLIGQEAWEGVALLFHCLECIPTDFDNLDSIAWNCENISIGRILQQLPDSKLITFGESLIISLCDSGADIEDIGRKSNCPTLHHIVRLSLQIKSLVLLNFIADKYKTSHLKMNVVDRAGSTPLHVLVHTHAITSSPYSGKVLEVLLRSKCDATVVDNAKKKPIDYITNKRSILYQKLLPASTKSVEELRQDLDNLKSQGNAALKSGNHLEALQMYDAALKVSQKSQYLYKEAAILYSNRANVHCTLKQYTDALPNALAAINCDTNYPKGYLWKARALQHMGSYFDAFLAYVDGYRNTGLTLDHRYVFLTDACSILKDLNVNMIKSLLTGHAANVQPLDSPTNCILTYIKQCDPIKEGPWLDALLCITIYHGNKQSWLSLAVDENDCALHGVVRFCLSINRTSVLEHFVSSDWIRENGGQNKSGDTAFHCITKHQPISDSMIVLKITKLLVKHGLSISRRDGNGKLAVEYLDKNYSGELFNYYFKAVPSANDVNKLKEAGNAKHKNRQYVEALQLYGQAIEAYEYHSTELRRQLSDHEIAILYGNRAEAFLAMKQYDQAEKDAKRSVDYDGHWHKAHMRMGKCMKAKGSLRKAVEMFANAYTLVESYTEPKIKVEILSEIAIVRENLPVSRERIESLPSGQGHIWLQVCYKMVESGNWNVAAVAYLHYTMDTTKPCSFRYDLKPFCDPDKLNIHQWAFDVLIVFMKYGCNRRTISIMDDDHYLQAIIIMTLIFGQNIKLLSYVVKRYGDHNYSDRRGNTLLHFTCQVKNPNTEMRYEVLAFLLENGVNPNLKNHEKHLAFEYIPPYELKSWAVLQNATRNAEAKKKSQKPQITKSKQSTQHVGNQSTQPKVTQKPKKDCEVCSDLNDQIANKLKMNELEEGYSKMVELCKMKHRGRKHDDIIKHAVDEIANKISETFHPGIIYF
ncbi:hypothetical protein ACF0H5_011825 [Mactra antiquata]